MQNKNEINEEIKYDFSIKKMRIIAIYGLFGFMAGVALVIYYAKFTAPLFSGSAIYKTSMVLIGQKDYFSAEDGSNLILFADRVMQNSPDCKSSDYGDPSKGSITAEIVDKKSTVIRVSGKNVDAQILKICLSSFMDKLSSFDRQAVSSYRNIEAPLTSNNSNFARESIQVNISEGAMIGEINITNIPITQYPTKNPFKLIFLFSLGGIFIGILIFYCKAIFMTSPRASGAK